MTSIDLAIQKTDERRNSFDATLEQSVASLEARGAAAEATRQRHEGLARLFEPGGVPHAIASVSDYVGPAVAEAVVDPVLSLGAGAINWAGWAMNAVGNAASGRDPLDQKPTLPPVSLRSTVNWLTDGEYARRVDYGRKQFEGETGELTPMMATRLIAQEAIGLFTSFGGADLAAKAMQGGGAVSAAVRGAANVLGAPGKLVHGIGKLFDSAASSERYSSIAMRMASKVGMTADEVNAAAATGRLTRDLIAKVPLTSKFGAFLKLKQAEMLATGAGLGALGIIEGANQPGGANPMEAAKTALTTAIATPVMVGMGSLAKTAQAALGGKMTAKMIAGAMEGTGFAAITMSPKEWVDYGEALLDGDWEKVGEGTVRVLGQAVGMAALRGFSPDGLPAWRRNFPQDRVKPLKELAANADRVRGIQELGWVGTPVDGAVEFRQPGRKDSFTLREGEGGKLTLSYGHTTVTGEEARDALRYLEARSAEEALLPHLHEIPESWTETSPGVFRDVKAAKEYSLRGEEWSERDLSVGGNAPWGKSDVAPELRRPRDLTPDLLDDIREVARLAEIASKELSAALKAGKDPLFHVELAQHLTAALIRGPEGQARSEARAFLRSSPHLPASEVIRSAARLFAGLSNAQHELAKPTPGGGGRRRAADGGKLPETAGSGDTSRQLESDVLANSRDWSKASRATRRTSAAEYLQRRRDEGSEASDDDLRRVFGIKDARTKKKVRRMAEEPIRRYGATTGKPGLEGEAGVEPIRQMDVSRALRGRPGDPVQATGREGGVSRRGALGVYHVFEDVDRARVGSDWATRAHEWAHAMERTVGGREGMGASIPPELLAEASTVARYYGDSTGQGAGLAKMKNARTRAAEVWAEYWARHILGDEARLATEAPKFHRWAQEWLRSQPNLADQVDYLKSVMHRWQYQGAKARALGQIVSHDDQVSPEQRMVEGSKLTKLIHGIEHQFFNAGGSLRRAEAALGKGDVDVKPSEAVWKTARLLAMAGKGEAERMLMFGTHDALGNRTGEAAVDIWKHVPDGDRKEMGALMVALREAEMMGKGLATSGSREELSARIRALEPHKVYQTPDGPMSRVQIARRFNDWFNRVVDYTVERGLFDEATGKKIKDASRYYNPFYRQFFEDAPSATAAGQDVPGMPIRRQVTGGVREVLDPREAMQRWAVRVISASHHAAVRNVLAAKIAQEGAGRLAFEVPISRIPHEHKMRQLLEEAAKVKTKAGSPEDALKLLEIAESTPGTEALEWWMQAKSPDSRRPWIAHTPHWSEAFIADVETHNPEGAARLRAKNNKLMWIEVQPEVYDYIVGSGVGNVGRAAMGLEASSKLKVSVQNLARAAAGLQRFGITEVKELFAVRNIIRDAWNYPLYQTPTESLPKWFKALGPFEGLATFIHTINAIQKDPLWEKFKSRAGLIPTLIRSELSLSGWKQADLFAETKTAVGKIRQGLKSYVEFLSKSEGVLRFREFKSTYEKRLKEGWSEQDAIDDATFAGKDLMDYTSGGVVARAWGQYVPYLGAHLVGQRKFWSTALGHDGEERQTRLWTHAIVNFGSMSIAAWLLMKLQKKDDQWAALDEKRRSRYWHLAIPGTDSFIELPKPYEAAMMVSGIMDQVLDRFGKTHPADLMQAALTFIGNVAGPFGNPMLLTPAMLRPGAEWATNKDFYSGRAIVPDWMAEGKIPEQQAHRWNSAAAKAVGKVLGLSPAQIDHFLGGTTGGLWNSTNRWVDDMASAIAGDGLKPGLLGGLGQLVPHAYQSSQRVTDFYEQINRLKQLRGSKLIEGPDKNKLRILERAADNMAKVREGQDKMSRATLDAELHRIANDALVRSGF